MPVFRQLGDRAWIGGLEPGDEVLLRCPDERVYAPLPVPDDPLAWAHVHDVVLAGLPRRHLEGGIAEFERLRAMYRGSPGAACHLHFEWALADGRTRILPGELFYFFLGGLGAYADEREWWVRSALAGRYVLRVVGDGGKELDRVGLAFRRGGEGK